MTIHLISFASLLHKQATLRSSHEAILSELEKYYTVKLVDYQDMDKLTSDDFKIIFIATGGVERLVQSPNQKIPDRKTKCVIKTHINIKQNVIFGAKLKPV